MSTTIAGLSYLGVPTYQEVSDSGIDLDDYGLDTLTRVYEVRPDYLTTFLALFPKGTQDSTYTWLYSISRKIANVRGPMCKATITFKGLQGGTPGTFAYHEQTKGGVAKAQVVLGSFDGTGQRTLDYRGPWTEWRYVTTRKPEAPGHVGEMVNTALNFTMLSTNGSAGTIYVNPTPLVPPVNPPDFNMLYTYNGLIVIQNSAFEFEEIVKPKAGSTGATSIWSVIERNEARIVDYAQYYIQQFLVNLGNSNAAP